MTGARDDGAAPGRRERAAKIVRRISWVFAALAVVTSPWWGLVALRHLDFFRVRRVEIDGARYVSPDEIVSRLRIDTTRSLFDDVGPLETRVRAHPSVRDVRIERKLPGTLLVKITENLPVAFVQGASGLVVVDAAGRSLPVNPATADVDLPVLAVRDTLALRVLGQVRDQAPALFTRIGEVRRVPEGSSFYLLFRLTGSSSGPARDVLAASDVTADRLSDIVPVEQDLMRRDKRAVELDLRFRDQVIARLP
ncbi:MAG TPA: FtsQ-type POTRA domain-containing protein [Gemmatimonadaceae bacterium]|nr:FtsQ-type POTRA domain-containing protein [Gemmatimonadaceae bacterium]